MMIDEKGRLFGKISIIDIATVLIILIIAGFLLNKFNILSSAEGVTLDDLQVVFYQEEVNDFSAESVEIGAPTKEALKNASFGEVIDVEIGDSISWDKDPDGKQVASSRDGYVSFRATMKTKGRLGPNGVTLDGATYHIGQTITLKIGNSIFYGNIADARKI